MDPLLMFLTVGTGLVICYEAVLKIKRMRRDDPQKRKTVMFNN
jgi:hypothetical protein